MPFIDVEVTDAVRVAITASGGFLLAGMGLGVWKYRAIARSPDARAPVYVDIAHRAALMYAFACLVLAQLAALSPYSPRLTLWATALPIVYFAIAVSSYALHGALRDTDNQLARPHVLGRHHLPPGLMSAFMWSLIAAELGGTAVLLWGAITVLW